jgi:hypothetical protein
MDSNSDSRAYHFHTTTTTNTPKVLGNIPWPRASQFGVPPAPGQAVRIPNGMLHVDATITATLSDGSETVTFKQRAQVCFAGTTPGAVVTNTVNTLPADGGAGQGFAPSISWNAENGGCLQCLVTGPNGVTAHWDGSLEAVWNDGE